VLTLHTLHSSLVFIFIFIMVGTALLHIIVVSCSVLPGASIHWQQPQPRSGDSELLAATIDSTAAITTVSEGGSAIPQNVFIHIPKTAGISLTYSLAYLARSLGKKVRFCGSTKEEIQTCLPVSSQRSPFVIGEFVSNQFVELMSKPPPFVWAMQRNPLLRTLSELEMMKRKKFLSQAEIDQYLSSDKCQLNSHMCLGLWNPSKCKAGGQWSACAPFGDHQALTLGEPLHGQHGSALELAQSRLQNHQVRPLILEHYQASICLVLHTLRHTHPNMDAQFGNCCKVIGSTCSLFQHKENQYHDDSQYWNKYLNKVAVQQNLLKHNRMDCVLYQESMESFFYQVRSMEKERGVLLLNGADTGTWTCEQWLANFVRQHR